MRIMREHNVKPMGGCLPMLIQLPIFLIVYSAVQLYLFQFSNSYFLWINPACTVWAGTIWRSRIGSCSFSMRSVW